MVPRRAYSYVWSSWSRMGAAERSSHLSSPGRRIAYSWLIRWDYRREPPLEDYAYPRAHVHINSFFANGAPMAPYISSPPSVAGARLRNLISDWGVEPEPRTGKRSSKSPQR